MSWSDGADFEFVVPRTDSPQAFTQEILTIPAGVCMGSGSLVIAVAVAATSTHTDTVAIGIYDDANTLVALGSGNLGDLFLLTELSLGGIQPFLQYGAVAEPFQVAAPNLPNGGSIVISGEFDFDASLTMTGSIIAAFDPLSPAVVVERLVGANESGTFLVYLNDTLSALYGAWAGVLDSGTPLVPPDFSGSPGWANVIQRTTPVSYAGFDSELRLVSHSTDPQSFVIWDIGNLPLGATTIAVPFLEVTQGGIGTTVYGAVYGEVLGSDGSVIDRQLAFNIDPGGVNFGSVLNFTLTPDAGGFQIVVQLDSLPGAFVQVEIGWQVVAIQDNQVPVSYSLGIAEYTGDQLGLGTTDVLTVQPAYSVTGPLAQIVGVGGLWGVVRAGGRGARAWAQIIG